MLGYDQPMLRSTAPIVAQDFDFIHETDRTTVCGQVKCPSLEDYDDDDLDGEECEQRLHLERWGDLQVPERLIAA